MGDWVTGSPGPGCGCTKEAEGPTRYPCACIPAYSATLARVPESAAAARYLVRSALDAWRLPGLRDSATHVVSELVANAAEHARGRSIRVTVTRTRRCRVRLAVVDFDSAHVPAATVAAPDDEGGRGLAIVAELAESWGVRLMSNRKQVWADVEDKEMAT